VPVTAKVGLSQRNDHEMAEPGRDLAVAPRTEVGLGGLVRLDAAYLQRVDVVAGEVVVDAQPSTTHNRQAAAAKIAAATNT